MYNVSNGFHSAALAPSPEERVRFCFYDDDNTVFGNERVQIASGVKVQEYFIKAEELTIGTCASSVLNAVFMNNDGALNSFEFGKCKVYLDLKINGAWEAVPLGVFIINKPTKRKVSLVSVSAYDQMCLLDAFADDWWDSLVWPMTLEDIYLSMCAYLNITAAPFASTGIVSVTALTTAARAYPSETSESLGTLHIGASLNVIDTFEKLVTTYTNGVPSYSYSRWWKILHNGAEAFIAYEDAGETNFINSSRSYASAPMECLNVTFREILGWIAEAACSVARFNRDGELELVKEHPCIVQHPKGCRYCISHNIASLIRRFCLLFRHQLYGERAVAGGKRFVNLLLIVQRCRAAIPSGRARCVFEKRALCRFLNCFLLGGQNPDKRRGSFHGLGFVVRYDAVEDFPIVRFGQPSRHKHLFSRKTVCLDLERALRIRSRLDCRLLLFRVGHGLLLQSLVFRFNRFEAVKLLLVNGVALFRLANIRAVRVENGVDLLLRRIGEKLLYLLSRHRFLPCALRFFCVGRVHSALAICRIAA